MINSERELVYLRMKSVQVREKSQRVSVKTPWGEAEKMSENDLSDIKYVDSLIRKLCRQRFVIYVEMDDEDIIMNHMATILDDLPDNYSFRAYCKFSNGELSLLISERRRLVMNIEVVDSEYKPTDERWRRLKTSNERIVEDDGKIIYKREFDNGKV